MTYDYHIGVIDEESVLAECGPMRLVIRVWNRNQPQIMLARQAAEEEIYESALEDGILQKANDNAELFLERLLDDLGFEDILFTPYEPDESPTPEATS